MSDSSTLVFLAQILLRDEEFQRDYSAHKYGINRRNGIKRALDGYGYGYDTEKNDREQLRRYFDELWRLPVAEYSNDTADLTGVYVTVYFERYDMGQIPCRDAKPDHQTDNCFDAVQAMENGRLVSILLNPIIKETIMNNAATSAPSAPITVTTQVLINGKLASQYSDADLFQSIALQEKAIKELDDIENKPASLVDEIAARKAGIQALVTYLDSRPKK